MSASGDKDRSGVHGVGTVAADCGETFCMHKLSVLICEYDYEHNARQRFNTLHLEGDKRAVYLWHAEPLADCDFNLAPLHPAYPTKRRTSAQRTQGSHGVETQEEHLPTY